MDDLEKMKTGMWLYARKPQIREALQRCEELVFRFNSLPPSREEERNAIIRQLFGRTGGTFCIHSPFHCDFGSQISIGEDFTGNFNLTILDEAPVTIGNHVFIGPNVGIYTVTHALLPDQRNAGVMRSLPITCLLYTSPASPNRHASYPPLRHMPRDSPRPYRQRGSARAA